MNWKYVLSEIALIVVGILLALTMSNWYERKREHADEVAVLEELRTALRQDQASLAAALDTFQIAERRVAALQSYIASGLGYADSLDTNFGAAYGIRLVSVNKAAFRSLESRGTDLIENRALRSRITGLYDVTYVDLSEAQRSLRDVILFALRPYFLTHFRHLEFNHRATPMDYDSLTKDIEFLNLLDYRLQVLRLNDIPAYERAVSEVEGVISALDEALDRRR